MQQGWITAEPSRTLKCRRPRPDRARALSRAEVEQLLTREDISLRERTLWRMLYETAARSAEVLALNVEDLDLPNRQAKVRRKGGAIDVIIWQTGTAHPATPPADPAPAANAATSLGPAGCTSHQSGSSTLTASNAARVC
jgi:site-specific recombinase XerC